MNILPNILSELQEFVSCDKYIVYEYLQPAVALSTPEDRIVVNEEMNFCATQLITHLRSAEIDEKELVKIVRDSVSRIEDAGLDTEDREFCYMLYRVIEEILGIEVEDTSKSMEETLREQLQNHIQKSGLRIQDLISMGKQAGMDDEMLKTIIKRFT